MHWRVRNRVRFASAHRFNPCYSTFCAVYEASVLAGRARARLGSVPMSGIIPWRSLARAAVAPDADEGLVARVATGGERTVMIRAAESFGGNGRACP